MNLETVNLDHSGQSFFVVNKRGILRQVFVPIKLKCVAGARHIPVGAYVFADAVIVHKRHHWLYWINQQVYPHSSFDVQANW